MRHNNGGMLIILITLFVSLIDPVLSFISEGSGYFMTDDEDDYEVP